MEKDEKPVNSTFDVSSGEGMMHLRRIKIECWL